MKDSYNYRELDFTLQPDKFEALGRAGAEEHQGLALGPPKCQKTRYIPLKETPKCQKGCQETVFNSGRYAK